MSCSRRQVRQSEAKRVVERAFGECRVSSVELRVASCEGGVSCTTCVAACFGSLLKQQHSACFERVRVEIGGPLLSHRARNDALNADRPRGIAIQGG